MSDFVANHLLFEYARNTLDPERKQSVEKALEAAPELQNEFIKLINGIQYCEKLSETLINDAAIKQIELQSSQVNFIVNRLRWHQWPLGFRWLVEAGVVALLLVVVLNVLPLNRIIHLNEGADNQTIVAEVERKKKPDLGESQEANVEKPDFTDEEVKQPLAVATKDKTPNGAKLKEDPVPTVTAPTKPVAVATKPPEPPVSVAATTTPPVSATTPAVAIPPKPTTQPVAVVSSPVTEKSAKSTGWIYRGQFLVTNAEAVSPKIKDKIKELGGQKAGEVEIGWLKTPNVYYFHFTVPEAKLVELEALLKEYSSGKIIKEAHPRVMPDGIIRMLFTVEEKAADAKAASENK
ncbi:MAG: hypothetical protein B7Y39_04030 [Bdellovibrio sp. 28-41-41]|nr:MAG: hypothetical protein B7Y39_04030 [Bdellovibrio sp. 28-41-41]